MSARTSRLRTRQSASRQGTLSASLCPPINTPAYTAKYTVTHTTVSRPFFQDHPGQPVPEENFWTEADTLNIRTKQCPPPPSPVPTIFNLRAGCPSCRPTHSVKALKANTLNTSSHTWLNTSLHRASTHSCTQYRVAFHQAPWEHSLLPDHASATVFLHMSIDLICP